MQFLCIVVGDSLFVYDVITTLNTKNLDQIACIFTISGLPCGIRA